MKRNTSFLILISVAVSSLFLTSCEFLSVDQYAEDTLQYDSVFSQKANLEKYIWGTAGQLPDESRIFGNEATFGVTAGDDFFTLMTADLFHGKALTLNYVSASNTSGLGVWSSCYKVIRKANLILSRIDECRDLTPLAKQELLGYVHFMRGYAYYMILMNHGPAVLLGDIVFNNNEDIYYYDRPRATFDETVDYICEELETAAKYIPADVSIVNFGRPSKGAAYALIARTRLHAASPAFNGGEAARRWFGTWTREDGVHYISQTYDERKWALAAAAAKRVMDMDGGERYRLHTVEAASAGNYITPALPEGVPSDPFPNGAGGIDPLKSYTDMFNGETYPTQNKEFIWAKNSGEVTNYTQQSFPMFMGGYSGMCLTQKVIDAFKMRDGKTIEEAQAVGEYSEEGNTTSASTFSGYRLNRGINKMYANREMRFYANVGFSGCYWTGTSCSTSGFYNVTVEYYVGANAGVDRSSGGDKDKNYAVTGYVLRKYIHPEDNWYGGGGSTRITKPYPIIRYAEILLIYAEAINHLQNSYTINMADGSSYTLSREACKDEMISSFNQIRFRAGLPGLREQDYATEEAMNDQIVTERFVEFLGEGHRPYDVRRWGIYEQVENEPIVGMNIEGKKADFFQRTIINHADYRNRVVNKRNVFLPLSRDEIRKAPSLDQNPGWED